MIAGVTDPMGARILWVAPVFYGLLGLALGIGVGLVTHVIRLSKIAAHRQIQLSNEILIGLILWWGGYTLINILFSTEQWAVSLLALGISFQTVRLLQRHQAGAVGSLAGLSPWLVAGVVALIVIVFSYRKFQEDFSLAQRQPAPSNSPNVILITLDTLRADHLGAYGYERKTPNLDQFAAESLLFEQALTTSSWTLPSHASIMTGLLTHEHLADAMTGNRLDDRYYTLAEAFADNGYVTAAFVANTFVCTANRGFGQGFSHYEGFYWNAGSLIRLTEVGEWLSYRLFSERFGWYELGRKDAQEINKEFISWLPERPNRPFFVWLNYFDPHDPYKAPMPYDTLYGEHPANGDPGSFNVVGPSDWQGDMTPEETQRHIDSYDAAIAYLDDQLGVLFTYLKEQNLYDSTIIVITSDHGEAFGEHDLYGHANSLYRETLQAPLLIHYPETIPAGARVTQVVSLRDLAATLSEMAGLKLEETFPGQRLDTLWSAPQPQSIVVAELYQNPYHPASHPVSQSSLVSVMDDHWHVIFSEEEVEVFGRDDLLDQHDLGNIPGSDGMQTVLMDLGKSLMAELELMFKNNK